MIPFLRYGQSEDYSTQIDKKESLSPENYAVDAAYLNFQNNLMKKSILTSLVASLFVLSGCAVGPLVSHETARSVGNSNHELVAGYGMTSFVVKWNYGLTENLDLGLHVESLSAGVRLKYAFVNSSRGWSFAGAIGAGESIGGDHKYADLITSYMASSGWEPYFTIRAVFVETDPLEFKSEDGGYLDFTIDEDRYSYGQGILGTRYWFTKNFLFSIEAGSLFRISSGFGVGEIIFAGAALGYRF